jgi:hypothetical protein
MCDLRSNSTFKTMKATGIRGFVAYSQLFPVYLFGDNSCATAILLFQLELTDLRA